MIRAIGILAVIVAVSSLQLSAQEPAAPQPTDAHKIFAEDAGTWDAVVKSYHQGPKGPATESKGVETNELVSGGMYSRTTFKYTMRDREFEGHGLFGYDPRSKEYTGLWVDNFTSIPTQLKGKYDAQQKTLTLTGAVVDGAGNEIKQKQVYKYVDGKTKTLTLFILVEIGGRTREIKIMEMTATKRA
jgi:hypothetical protein